jgi:general secretion pathway protein G
LPVYSISVLSAFLPDRRERRFVLYYGMANEIFSPPTRRTAKQPFRFCPGTAAGRPAAPPAAARATPARAAGTDAGLTLIEMIIVLAIIALVAALIVPSVIGRPDQARVTVAQADLKAIEAALKMYRLDNGQYPTTDQGLAALATKPTTAPVPANYAADAYLAHPPADPWGRPYLYKSPGADGAGFDLSSLGRDGKPGGDGVDADIADTSR